MSKPFDATTKFLIDLSPADWLSLAGVTLEPGAIVEPFDADLSTVSADADRLIRVSNVSEPCLYHIELQASYDAHFDEHVHWYNALARYQYRLPVRSIAFLLRKAADGANLKGAIDETEGVYRLQFGYAVVRLWQQDVQKLLSGGLAALPLAPLAATSRAEVAATVYAVHTRLYQELDLAKARDLSTATFVLLGLSYEEAFLETLTLGVQKMQESSFYQMILREGQVKGRTEGRTEGIEEGRDQGRLQEARENLLTLGIRRFGVPTEQQVVRINKEISRTQLEIWLLSLLDAKDWEDILGH